MIVKLGFIDPGLTNLGWMVVEMDDQTGEEFGCVFGVDSISPPGHKGRADRLSTTQILDGCCQWADGFCDRFDCDAYFVELQMTSKLKAVQNCLYTKFHPQVVLLAPASVKRRFDVLRGSHAANKRAAIEHVLNDPEEDPDLLERIRAYAKKDEPCDCRLMFKFVREVGLKQFFRPRT